MGEAKRRRDGLSVVPRAPGAGLARKRTRKPAVPVCNVTPGPAVEQVAPDGTVYHVQSFIICNAEGTPAGIATPAGFQAFTLLCAPIPVRKTVLVTPGAGIARA